MKVWTAGQSHQEKEKYGVTESKSPSPTQVYLSIPIFSEENFKLLFQ